MGDKKSTHSKQVKCNTNKSTKESSAPISTKVSHIGSPTAPIAEA